MNQEGVIPQPGDDHPLHEDDHPPHEDGRLLEGGLHLGCALSYFKL